MTSDSWIQPWLDFNGTLPGPLSPCTNLFGVNNPDGHSYRNVTVNVPCAHACNDTMSMFGTDNTNIINCGLWATIISAIQNISDYNYYQDSYNVTYATDAIGAHSSIQPFGAIGLGIDTLEYFPTIIDAISSIFINLFLVVKWNSTDEQAVPVNCTKQGLFGYGVWDEFFKGSIKNTSSQRVAPTVLALNDCVGQICTPRTFNGDLAGIGVILSLMMQLILPLAIAIMLATLQKLSPVPSSKSGRLHPALVTALVDFHRNQCCFAVSLQIASLTVFGIARNGPQQADTLDAFLVAFLAINGLVPVIFTWLCIGHFGRSSRYSSSLTMLPCMISTLILGIFTTWEDEASIPFQRSIYYPGESFDDLTQGIVVRSLCGADSIADNIDFQIPFHFGIWTWVVWVNCFLWVTAQSSKKVGRKSICYFPLFIQKIVKESCISLNKDLRRRLWLLIMTLTWTPCFTLQIYLCILFIQHSLISYTWSFGQIVAIAVWIPCLIEFAYIAYSQ